VDELLVIRSLGLVSDTRSPQLKTLGLVSDTRSPQLKTLGLSMEDAEPGVILYQINYK
jgi:hypothetical protein